MTPDHDHDRAEADDWHLAGCVTDHALERAVTALALARVRARHAAAEGVPAP
jgi:hypothetical protein